MPPRIKVLYCLSVLTCASIFWSLAYCQDGRIVVMSFNIYHGENPYHPGISNLDEVAELIMKYQPDLVALQEVDSMTIRSRSSQGGVSKNLVAELEKLTGMKGHFARAIDFSGGGYREAILSQLPATFATVALPSPMGGEGRSVAIAKVSLPGVEPFIFAGTHLCHEYETNRNAQAETLVQYLGELGMPVILAGDFNFEPSEVAHGILSKGLLDAAVARGASPEPTYPAEKPVSRIDYFWVSKSLRGKILSVKVLEVDFSDHRPILMEIEF